MKKNLLILAYKKDLFDKNNSIVFVENYLKSNKKPLLSFDLKIGLIEKEKWFFVGGVFQLFCKKLIKIIKDKNLSEDNIFITIKEN
jgi:hypothetical protein